MIRSNKVFLSKTNSRAFLRLFERERFTFVYGVTFRFFILGRKRRGVGRDA